MRAIAICASILCAAPAAAQYVEPEVQVQKLSAKEHPPVAEDEPAAMSADEFYRMRAKGYFIEEVAVIRIAFKGNWYRSADYLAREKAAALGANSYVLVESLGREEMGAGAVRTFRAFRMSDLSGRPVYTKPEEPSSSPAPQAPAAHAAGASAGKPVVAAEEPATPREHRHFSWVWEHGPELVMHRLGFDPARATGEEREQLRLYVRENFPAPEEGKLLRAYKARSRVALDFLKRTVE